MSQRNDEKIMMFKKEIEAQKEQLKKSEKFVPITNCNIDFKGVRYNIHTLRKDQIVPLMVELNVYALSARDLGLLDDYKVGNYLVTEWLEDLRGRLNLVTRKDEEAKLKALEAELKEMLSEEKKVELKLDEIEALLKKNKHS